MFFLERGETTDKETRWLSSYKFVATGFLERLVNNSNVSLVLDLCSFG